MDKLSPDRFVDVAGDVMAYLAKYLQTHDEMYFMDAYRLLKEKVEDNYADLNN